MAALLPIQGPKESVLQCVGYSYEPAASKRAVPGAVALTEQFVQQLLGFRLTVLIFADQVVDDFAGILALIAAAQLLDRAADIDGVFRVVP